MGKSCSFFNHFNVTLLSDKYYKKSCVHISFLQAKSNQRHKSIACYMLKKNSNAILTMVVRFCTIKNSCTNFFWSRAQEHNNFRSCAHVHMGGEHEKSLSQIGVKLGDFFTLECFATFYVHYGCDSLVFLNKSATIFYLKLQELDHAMT